MNNLNIIIQLIIGIATASGVLISLWVGVIRPKIKRLHVEFISNHTEYVCVLNNFGDIPICLRKIQLFYIKSRWKYIISKTIIRSKFFEKIIVEIYHYILKKKYRYPSHLRGVCSLSEVYYMPVREDANKIEKFVILEAHSLQIIHIDVEAIRRNIGHVFDVDMLPKDKKVKLIVTDADYKMFEICTEYKPLELGNEILEIQNRKNRR